MAEDRGERCYAELKAMLIEGDVAMGARLTESALADRLGGSRTPVREALRRLHAEGFVDFSANRGYAAAVYDEARVREIFTVRALLESEAASLIAAAGLGPERNAALERDLAEGDALLASDRTPTEKRAAFLLINNRFHQTLREACPNRTLAGLIGRMTEIPKAIRNYFRFPDDELARRQSQHRRIHAALRSGDAVRASVLMREHIWSAQDHIIDGTGRPDVAAE